MHKKAHLSTRRLRVSATKNAENPFTPQARFPPDIICTIANKYNQDGNRHHVSKILNINRMRQPLQRTAYAFGLRLAKLLTHSH